MSHLQRALALFIVVGPANFLAAADPVIAPQAGILVLRSGGVLRGDITRIGDQFVIAFGDNSDMRLPAAAVEMHCRDLDDAFQRKLAALVPDSAEKRLDLVEWCLRQRMIDRAAGQLLSAVAMDPRNPRIERLERVLAVATRAEQVDDHTVQRPNTVLSNDDVDEALRDVPDAVVERFTTAIQPVLLNSCSTSHCHGPNSQSEFRLLRPAPGRTIGQRVTQRNLYVTLQTIDRDHPAESPLLKAPRQPHGSADAPIFGKFEEPQYQDFVAWVKLAARGKPVTRPTTISGSEPRLLQTTDPRPIAVPTSRTADESRYDGVPGPATRSGTALEGRPTARINGQNARPLPPGERTKVAQSLGSPSDKSDRNPQYVPRDPFDPEVFNRRYFGSPLTGSTDAVQAGYFEPADDQDSSPDSEHSPRASASRK